MAEGMGWMLSVLGDSALAQALRSGLYPVARFVHLFGVALMVGPLIVLDLKLLWGARAPDVQTLHKQLIPIVLIGFVLALAAGSTLFSVQPELLVENGALRVKLGLLTLGCLNALWFERVWRRHVGIELLVRVSAALSMVIWVSVIAASTWIPYWQA